MTGRLQRIGRMLRPLWAILCGLTIAALVMQLSGYNVREAYGALFTGATGIEQGAARGTNQIALSVPHYALKSYHLNTFLLAQSLAKMTPLLFCGLAIALGLRAGLFNIGAQGQMTVGALAAAYVGQWGIGKGDTGTLPPLLHITLVMGAGATAGALWGALPGLLKAYRGVHEVIATIMLNYVAINATTYFVTHNLKDPNSAAAQSARVAKSAWLVPYVAGSNLTAGFLIALLAAAALAFLISRTSLGFRIRAVGMGADAAAAAGISVPRTLITTMALSGALAGLAGAIEVAGVHHRFIQGIASNYGYDGIAVALLGGLGGGGVALSALFFGALSSGASHMQTLTDVPDSIAVIVQAIVIIFVGVRYVRKDSRKRRTFNLDEMQPAEIGTGIGNGKVI